MSPTTSQLSRRLQTSFVMTTATTRSGRTSSRCHDDDRGKLRDPRQPPQVTDGVVNDRLLVTPSFAEQHLLTDDQLACSHMEDVQPTRQNVALFEGRKRDDLHAFDDLPFGECISNEVLVARTSAIVSCS